MKYLQHLDDEKIQDVIKRLSEINDSMEGLVTLLTRLKDIDFDGHDLRGVGKLIEGQLLQLSIAGEILKFGEPQDEEE